MLALFALVAIVIGLSWLLMNPAWSQRGDPPTAPQWGAARRAPFR
jgi:hypothetical protein